MRCRIVANPSDPLPHVQIATTSTPRHPADESHECTRKGRCWPIASFRCAALQDLVRRPGKPDFANRRLGRFMGSRPSTAAIPTARGNLVGCLDNSPQILRAIGLDIASYNSAAEKSDKTTMGFTLERRRMIIRGLDTKSSSGIWRRPR